MKSFYFSRLIIPILFLLGLSFKMQAQTYTTPGAGAYVYTVPAGCSGVQVDVAGAKGGDYNSTGVGGRGGRVQANLAVTPGQLLYLFAGAAGGNGSCGSAGNSYGSGQNGGSGGCSGGGAGGGAASDIRTSISGGAASTTSLYSRVVVGGGGGGGNFSCSGYLTGGTGGYPAGGNGTGACSSGVTGGNQSGGGSGNCYSGCGAAGGLGYGGNATFWGGGGGGGYYGGGGGSEPSGGGGSSYAGTGTSSVTYSNGYQNGAGSISITPLVPVISVLPTSLNFGNVTTGSTSVPPMFFEITGSYMGAGPLTVTAPGSGCFEVSTDGSTWGSTTTVTYTPPNIVPRVTKVYVRFIAGGGVCTGNITITGGGLATTFNVPVSGNGASGCSGTIVAGSAAASPMSAGAYTDITLSLTGVSAVGGLTYQWQKNGVNIPGAVLPTYIAQGITATSVFRCLVACGAGTPVASNPVTVTYAGIATSSCVPTCLNTLCCNFFCGNPSFPLFIQGDGTSSLTDGVNTNAKYYDNVLTHNVVMSIGNTYSTVNIGSATNPSSVQIWIDFNNDGTFSNTTETVGGLGTGWSSGVAHPAISIPATGVNPGLYRMRVSLTYTAGFAPGANAGYPVYPQGNACPTSGVQYAETRDYSVTITNGACSGAPYPGIVDASIKQGCAPFTTNLFNVGQQLGSGITYQWWQSGDGVSFFQVGGATTASYTATVSSPGSTFYQVRATCGSSTSITLNTVEVVLNTPPGAVTGSNSICTGLTSVYTAAPSGGTWSTSDVTLATAGSLTGIITGTGVGIVDVIYTLPTGCSSSKTITVNQLPGPITGTTQVCQLATTTLSNSIPGGTWTGNPGSVIATGSSTGVVTGIAGGTANVTYTLPTGCQMVAPVTVNPLPPLYIVGMVPGSSASYCAGDPSTANINISGSTPGVSYQLLLGGSPVGAPLAGTGGSLSFGIQTTPGVYTVYATNNTSFCARVMIGSVTVFIRPQPLPQSVSGGGSYCAGGAGVSIMCSGSELAATYQLYNGTIPVGSPISGTGGAINFGLQTAAGIYKVLATLNGCSQWMIGTATITINPLPNAFDVTGGGGYCAGGVGVPVNLNFSNSGITYQLYNGSSPVGSPITGTGTMIGFGLQTVPGSYTVTATNTSTGCTNNMNYAAVVSVNLPPNVYNVLGSGSYCAGGIGVDIYTDGSDPGVNYQLHNGTSYVGGIVPGFGLGLDMGYQTVPGTYSVIGTDVSTGCTSTMSGTATVNVSVLPFAYNMTGGGSYCAGGAGVPIGLSSSATGITYQLYQSGLPVGSPLAGTGSALSFGTFNTTGVYTVKATNVLSGCENWMTGVSTIGVNPLPTAFNVTGTGAYCSGGTGVNVGLDFSATGVTYQLFRGGIAVGSPVTGTGAAISFGNQTIAATYTVEGTNVTTGCTSAMNGNAVITINPLPPLHLVTGGGNFCAGGSGVNVGLNGSTAGISYQLFLGLVAVGSPVMGTGSPISFGPQPLAGNYTIQATDIITGCVRNMAGGATVVVNPLPTTFTVTGGGIYCTGGTGVHVGLSGSASGIKYQLVNGSSNVGTPLNGTGSPIDFGLQLAPGTYTVVATNATTGCVNPMAGSTTIALNILPNTFMVTGGGSYCVGGSGLSIGLDGSDPGMSYQLYVGTTATGLPMSGTGFAIDFGAQTAAGTYTVKATDMTTGCMGNMASSANITINALPVAHNVLGGGNYCAGGTGNHVFLNLSNTGIEYQLYNGSTAVGSPMSGTGASLDFGLFTTTGTYSVIATNTATGCGNTMTGTATININPLPAAHAVTGGGSYCSGGTGVTVGLDGTETGIKYQLMYGTSAMGVAVAGTGSAVSFGLQTGVGAYTVVATDIATTCTSDMTGAANVNVNPLPAAFSMTGGGNYCATGIGVHVNLNGSEVGVNYQLYRAGAGMVGLFIPGTGGALDMGLQTAPGVYTVVATNNATGCVKNMTGSSNVNVIPVVLPHVDINPSIAGIVCIGQSVTYTASPINGGTSPTYQWWVNDVSAGVGNSFTYMPADGDIVKAQINSNAECAIPTVGTNTMTMSVSPMQMPSASVSVYPGTLVCTGALTTFTATTLYGGSSPMLEWIKNGVHAGTGSTYSYVPASGDIITLQLTSNFNCRLADNVFSAPVTMTVQNPILPTVTVVANPGATIAPGQSVTFTASSTNSGPAPAYQWVVNSTRVPGATNPTFTTNTLTNRDSVTCEITGVCAMVGFNSIIMRVGATGVTQVSGSGSDVRLIPNPNKGEFSIRGTVATTENEVDIEVTNMLGQVVYNGKAEVKNGSIDARIQLSSSLANGMYLLNLRSGVDHNVFHFVIEQ